MNSESLSESTATQQSPNNEVRQRLNSNNSTATYRDLVIFEERLRGNMNRLLKRKRKYESMSNLEEFI